METVSGLTLFLVFRLWTGGQRCSGVAKERWGSRRCVSATPAKQLAAAGGCSQAGFEGRQLLLLQQPCTRVAELPDKHSFGVSDPYEPSEMVEILV